MTGTQRRTGVMGLVNAWVTGLSTPCYRELLGTTTTTTSTVTMTTAMQPRSAAGSCAARWSPSARSEGGAFREVAADAWEWLMAQNNERLDHA